VKYEVDFLDSRTGRRFSSSWLPLERERPIWRVERSKTRRLAGCAVRNTCRKRTAEQRTELRPRAWSRSAEFYWAAATKTPRARSSDVLDRALATRAARYQVDSAIRRIHRNLDRQ
jgi:hypothetical protein